MLLLSSLLGPAKPPVASREDVASAPGVYRIQRNGNVLVASALNGVARIQIARGERCLVCLCDYEVDEEVRQLAKCAHLFHRECIDVVRSHQTNGNMKSLSNLLLVAHDWSQFLPSLQGSRGRRESRTWTGPRNTATCNGRHLIGCDMLRSTHSGSSVHRLFSDERSCSNHELEEHSRLMVCHLTLLPQSKVFVV